MTTRYPVEYGFKAHRRDQLIEWIKGLLAVPFVLQSQSGAEYETRQEVLVNMAAKTQKRYGKIFGEVCSWLIHPQAKQQIGPGDPCQSS